MRIGFTHRWLLTVTCIFAALLALSNSGLAEQLPAQRDAESAAESAQPAELQVELMAGKYDRQRTPVFIDVPKSLRGHTDCSLLRLDKDTAVDVQLLAGEQSRLVWILDEPLAAGRVRQYRLVPASDQAKSVVTCRDNGKQMVIAVGDRPVLNYNHAMIEAPPGLESHYRRNGHIHPLFSPAGLPVTDDFPPDHAHQHAIFFPWVNTTFEGRQVDFWNQAKELGMVEHVALKDPVSGPVFGQFEATLRHSDLTDPSGPKPALTETWTVRVYNLHEQFVIDFESRQECAGTSPLTINEFHYGGMSMRGNRQWFGQPEADFLTSEGKTRADGNHTRPRWVEMHGNIDSRPTGVLVMGDPTNFRFPQPVRLHPTKPYFCFAPMVLGSFAIKPGAPYISRFRYCTHDGKPDIALAERLWNDFAHPLDVRVHEVTERQ